MMKKKRKERIRIPEIVAEESEIAMSEENEEESRRD